MSQDPRDNGGTDDSDVQPENGQPENGQPQDGQPENGQPENGQPENGQPENRQPQDGQPENGQPENVEPRDPGLRRDDGSSGPEDPVDEDLSGTLFGSVQGVAATLGGLSTTFAAVGVFAIVVGVVLLIFLADLRFYGYIVLIAGGAALLLAMLISFQAVVEAITSRRGRYGTNTALMILAFVGIAAIVNFLAFENSARVDVTASKQFSLAPRTLSLLEGLDKDVEAKAFFVPGRNVQEELALQALIAQTEDFLREFEARSGRFEYEFIDPVVEPLTANEYGATSFPVLVLEELESGRRHQLTPTFALEQDLVTALLIVTGQEQKQVYFLSGHGESDPSNEQRDTEGYGLARRGIESENYAVSTLNLSFADDRRLLEEAAGAAQQAGDDEDGSSSAPVSMLVIAAPKTNLPDEEAQFLHQYLKAGGSMMFLGDPDTPPSFRDFLASWGVVMGDGHIVDQQRNTGQSEIAVLARDQYISLLPDPDLDRILSVGQLTGLLDTTYYPGVTSVSPAEEGALFFPDIVMEQEPEEEERTPTVFGTALGFTSPDSWLIKEPTRNEPDESAGDVRDIYYPGVVVRAVGRVDEPPPENVVSVRTASLVVFGDSDFASNQHFFSFDNSDLFLNSVNWLVGDTPLASIRPKPSPFRPLVLTKNEFNFMRYSSWLLLPILMAVSGAFVWYRRR